MSQVAWLLTVYSVIYRNSAHDRDVAHHSSHLKIKCIFNYINQKSSYNYGNLLEGTSRYGELEYVVPI